MPGDSYVACLGRMLELPVAAALRHLKPTILFNEAKHVAYFHSDPEILLSRKFTWQTTNEHAKYGGFSSWQSTSLAAIFRSDGVVAPLPISPSPTGCAADGGRCIAAHRMSFQGMGNLTTVQISCREGILDGLNR